MLRQIIQAIRNELERWRNPTQEQPVPKEWCAEDFFRRLEADPRCFVCAREKQRGVLLCLPCEKAREPSRKAS